MIRYEHLPQFITITNLNWQPVLQNDYHKQIILEALARRSALEQVTVYGFVIMPNHLHFIWQLHDGINRAGFQRDFLKFTAQRIKEDLAKHHPAVLQQFRVEAKDRQYQFWERNPLSVELWTEKVVLQKLTYIHLNPVRAGLCRWPEEYKYSSALFYHTGVDNWGFLTHLRD